MGRGTINIHAQAVASAVRVLQRGGVVLYPTETSYALGCDARNKRAVVKLFKLKGRRRTKDVPVIVSSHAMARRWFVWNSTLERLAQRYWPGPLTVIAQSRVRLPVSRTHDVAVRVSGHPLARSLSRALGSPLVSTSANRSGSPPCFSVEAVMRQLGKKMDSIVVLDVGRLPRSKPSTIVRVDKGTIVVLRDGALKLDAVGG